MVKHSVSCPICKQACHQNQNLISCMKCRCHAHFKCSKVGMNIGKNNFVCVGCHQKRASLRNLVKSTIFSPENSASDDDSNVPLDDSIESSGVSNDSPNQQNNSFLSSHLYYSVEDLNSMLQSKLPGDLFTIHINASSLPKHFDTISSLCIDKFNRHPDIICITESRLKDKKIDDQLKFIGLDDYKLIYDNSPTNAGGVAVYVKKNIFDLQVKSDLRVKVKDCESVFLEFDFLSKKTNSNNAGKSFLLGCVYRHPRRKVAEKIEFIEEIYKTLTNYSDKNIPLVILGDININIEKSGDNVVRCYTNMLTSLGCKNLIDINTRFAENSRSTLDHVLSNIDGDQITSGVLNFPITDHLPVFALIQNHANALGNKSAKKDMGMWRFFDDRKKEQFLLSLEKKLEGINQSDHPEKILEGLTEATKSAIHTCFPLRKMSNRAKKRALIPWFDTEIFKDEKTQSRLFRRFVKSNDPEDHKAYKKFRNMLSKKKYKAKRKYFQNLLDEAKASGDRSATWSVINKAFGKNKKPKVCPKKVNIGDQKNPTWSENPNHIVDALNTHFTGIAKKLEKNLKKTKVRHTSYMGKGNNSSMFLRYTSLAEILEEMNLIDVKKSMGYDEIPPKIVKWAANLLAPWLMVIFNKCIDLGYYPSAMKTAKVTPIYKEGDKDDFSNYRPISVLTQFNQLFERLLSKRYLEFFEKFEIITKKQYGFLKKHCTEHAILDLKEYILSRLEKQEVMAVLFLDLQKAFDTVNHDILLEKLYHHGVRGNAYRLIKSYLSGRQQYTKIGDCLSTLAHILFGVPQGSVLGPLLFLIYINDLPNSSAFLAWLFADDTALALSSKNFRELEVRFNIEVEKVHDWLLANRLSVHYVDKTKYMLIKGHGMRASTIGSAENFKMVMGEHLIERTDKYKYLGVMFDDKLNWKHQVNRLCSKLASVCGVISKVRHYLDRKSLMLIYNSLFESRLRYGILGWGTCSKHELSRLQVLQNRAVRFISFSPYWYRVGRIYNKLEILPLKSLLELQRSTFMHCFHYETLPLTLNTYCKRPIHSVPTKYNSDQNYVLPVVKTNRDQTSIKFTGPKAWKEVPVKLKQIAFRKPFSRKMKEHILSKLLTANKNLPKDSPNPPYENKQGTENFGALRAIFEADDENTVFLGFENFDDLRAIFEADDQDYVFLGFEKNFDDLRAIFESDDENTVFLGFETCKTLEYLFQDSSGDELEEFQGFNVPVNMNDLFTDSGNEQEFLGF